MNNPDESSAPFSNTIEEIERGKLGLLAQQGSVNFITSNLIAPLLMSVALFLAAEAQAYILSWLALGIILFAVRAFHHRKFAKFNLYKKSVQRWELELIVLSMISGFYWAAACMLFVDPDKPGLSIILITSVFALISSSGAGLSTHPKVSNAFVFALWIPACIYFLVMQSIFYLQLAILGTFFVVVNVSFAVNQGRAITQSLQLRYENLQLLTKLREQKMIAEDANRAKSRFLAAASHDLRQPLHAMGLFTDSLSQRIGPGESRRILELLKSSMDSLKTLFNSLLDLSRLDAGVIRPEYKSINLGKLLAQLLQEYQPYAQAKKLSLRSRLNEAWVYSDPVLVEQILRNLIWNAIKYTEKGGVLVSSRKRAEGKILVEIWDTGIGVTEDEQSRIFDEFHQINNPERDRSQGIGLGLSIVQRTANLLNLQLGLSSRFGRGSRFFLSFVGIPAPENQPELQEKPIEILDSDLKGVCALVVDDDQDIRESLGLRLGDWGCQVVKAGSVSDVRQLLDDFSPDILLTDYQLNDRETGAMVIERVREAAGFDIPSIIITGTTMAEAALVAEREDVEILYKPVQPEELKNTMVQALNH